MDCPISNKYVERIKELSAKYSPRGVEFIGIDSADQDSIGAMVEHSRAYEIPFRLAKDWDGKTAEELAVTRTSEVLLISEDLHLVYKGRIDEQFDYTVSKAGEGRAYLREAIESALKGNKPPTERTEALGCSISYRSKTQAIEKPTYADNVAHIINDHCLACHTPNGVAPIPLDSYEKVKNWAQMVEETISDRRMPPWHADPRYGVFSNDRSLPEIDRNTVSTWIEQGMAPGNLEKLKVRAISSSDSWTLGTPNKIVSTPVYDVKTNGITYFENDFHKEKFEKETWVSAVEVKTSNPKVVHHVTVYVIPDGIR